MNFHQSLVAVLQAAKVDSDDLVKAMKRAMNVQVEHFASCCLYRLVTICDFVAEGFSRVLAVSLVHN